LAGKADRGSRSVLLNGNCCHEQVISERRR
jgi:hypothetical protein